MRLDIVYLIWNMESRYLESEVGGLSSTGKSFRVVRACARCVCLVSSGQKSLGRGFPFSLFQREVFPFPSALQGPIQFQLALSGKILQA